MAAAGGVSKNSKSPPPHSGWRLDNYAFEEFKIYFYVRI